MKFIKQFEKASKTPDNDAWLEGVEEMLNDEIYELVKDKIDEVLGGISEWNFESELTLGYYYLYLNITDPPEDQEYLDDNDVYYRCTKIDYDKVEELLQYYIKEQLESIGYFNNIYDSNESGHDHQFIFECELSDKITRDKRSGLWDAKIKG